MIARRVDHVSFAVVDLERSRRFYEGVLGLEQAPRPDLGIPGVWYEVGGGQVHLIQTPEGVDVGRGPGKLTPLANHSAFAVADYAETLELLKAKGVSVFETSSEAGQMWVQDPDGNVIELIAERARQ